MNPNVSTELAVQLATTNITGWIEIMVLLTVLGFILGVFIKLSNAFRFYDEFEKVDMEVAVPLIVGTIAVISVLTLVGGSLFMFDIVSDDKPFVAEVVPFIPPKMDTHTFIEEETVPDSMFEYEAEGEWMKFNDTIPASDFDSLGFDNTNFLD